MLYYDRWKFLSVFSHCNPYLKMLIRQPMFPVSNAYNTCCCHSHWDDEVLSLKDNAWQHCLASAEQQKSTLVKMTADTFTHCWLVFMRCVDWSSQRVKSWHISFHSIFSPLLKMFPVQSKQWIGELTAVLMDESNKYPLANGGEVFSLSCHHYTRPLPSPD